MNRPAAARAGRAAALAFLLGVACALLALTVSELVGRGVEQVSVTVDVEDVEGE